MTRFNGSLSSKEESPKDQDATMMTNTTPTYKAQRKTSLLSTPMEESSLAEFCPQILLLLTGSTQKLRIGGTPNFKVCSNKFHSAAFGLKETMDPSSAPEPATTLRSHQTL